MKAKNLTVFVFTAVCSLILVLGSLGPLHIIAESGFGPAAKYIINTFITKFPALIFPLYAVLSFFLDRQKKPFKILSAVLILFMLVNIYSQIVTFAGIPKYIEGTFLMKLSAVHMSLYYSAVAASAILQLFTPRFKKTKLIIFFAAAIINIAAALLIIIGYKTGLNETVVLLIQAFLLFPAFYDGFSLRAEKNTPCV